MKPKLEFFKASDFDCCKTFILKENSIHVVHSSQQVADKANALLAERGTVVYGCDDYKKYPEMKDKVWGWSEEGLGHDTHTALLIAIEPIAKDTAESLLREIVEMIGPGVFASSDVMERARKLIRKP